LTVQVNDLDAVQKAINEAWNRHKSVTAHMRMESHRTRPDAATDGKGEGTLEVLRKDELYLQRTEARTELKMVTPEETVTSAVDVTIILDGESEYLIREGNGQKFYTKVPVNPGISIVPKTVLEYLATSAPLNVLPEETIDGQKAYVIEAVRSEAAKTGTLRTVVYFSQATGVLLRNEGYDEAKNKVETINYSDFQFDLEIDPQRFVFEAPPGVNVIDRTKPRTPASTQSSQPGEPSSQPEQKPVIVGRLPEATSRPAEPPPQERPRP
jgi:outer membrane lipoprotein-sorting protein